MVALHLFARDGYEAVSVSQIAGELPPQIGQWIQREFFRLAFTLYTSNNGIAPR